MVTGTVKNQDEVVATTPDAIREQALRRARKRRGFKTHAFVYVLFNIFVWGIWAISGAASRSWWPWPVFVTVFWGIGLIMNAWEVYLRRPIIDAELQREIEHLTHPH